RGAAARPSLARSPRPAPAAPGASPPWPTPQTRPPRACTAMAAPRRATPARTPTTARRPLGCSPPACSSRGPPASLERSTRSRESAAEADIIRVPHRGDAWLRQGLVRAGRRDSLVEPALQRRQVVAGGDRGLLRLTERQASPSKKPVQRRARF